MATSRRTGTNENISTYDSGGGYDYSSLITWEADTDYDLVGSTISEVLECYNDTRPHSDKIYFYGANSNASYFRILRPADGEGHDGTPNNGVYFETNAALGTAYLGVIDIRENYVSVEDLIVRNLSSTALHAGIGVVVGLYTWQGALTIKCYIVGMVVTNCGYNGLTEYRYTTTSTGYPIIVNSVFLENAAHGLSLRAAVDGAYLYNLTSVDNGGHGLYNDSSTGTLYAKNVISTGNAGNPFQGAFNQTTCTSGAVTFVNSANDDYHLDSTDVVAMDNGTDLSGDAVFAFDDDVDWETRSGDWDIGFDEYVDISTTLAPTTLAPTTLAPTTLPPTTLAPTTAPPTTLAPTTAAPCYPSYVIGSPRVLPANPNVSVLGFTYATIWDWITNRVTGQDLVANGASEILCIPGGIVHNEIWNANHNLLVQPANDSADYFAVILSDEPDNKPTLNLENQHGAFGCDIALRGHSKLYDVYINATAAQALGCSAVTLQDTHTRGVGIVIGDVVASGGGMLCIGLYMNPGMSGAGMAKFIDCAVVGEFNGAAIASIGVAITGNNGDFDGAAAHNCTVTSPNIIPYYIGDGGVPINPLGATLVRAINCVAQNGMPDAFCFLTSGAGTEYWVNTTPAINAGLGIGLDGYTLLVNDNGGVDSRVISVYIPMGLGLAAYDVYYTDTLLNPIGTDLGVAQGTTSSLLWAGVGWGENYYNIYIYDPADNPAVDPPLYTLLNQECFHYSSDVNDDIWQGWDRGCDTVGGGTTVPPTTLPPTTPPPGMQRRGKKDFGFSMRDRWRI